nr:MAG TPA: putative pPIWI-associating nuclease [Caudoviricetes sp.]
MTKDKVKQDIHNFFSKNLLYLKILHSTYHSLRQYSNPLRFNNFCLGYRELFKMFLKETIQDTDIRACSWFSDENEKYFDKENERITRRAYLRYKIFNNLSDDIVQCFPHAFEEIDNFLKLYNKLSDFVHIKSATFDIDDEKIKELKTSFESCVLSLINNYNVLEKIASTYFFEEYHEMLEDYVCNYDIEEISLLSGSGYYINDFYIKNIDFLNGNNNTISIKIHGRIYLESYYGHGEESVSIPNDFPFSAQVELSISPCQIIQMNNIEVDTSSFYE